MEKKFITHISNYDPPTQKIEISQILLETHGSSTS